jgi:four helix bundle protein
MKEGQQKIQSFTDLKAWQEGHKLVLRIYRVTRNFPDDEKFGLTSQMRRCAVSITSNIAEGFSKRSNKDKSRFYNTSQGSITELQNQLIVARDVEYLASKDFDWLAEQSVYVHKLVTGLVKYADSN